MNASVWLAILNILTSQVTFCMMHELVLGRKRRKDLGVTLNRSNFATLLTWWHSLPSIARADVFARYEILLKYFLVIILYYLFQSLHLNLHLDIWTTF